MDLTYWQKQTEKPQFPELEWNKPERRDQAGRLLIVGGYLHNLNAPATSYDITKKQGIGNIKVALPDKTRPLLGKTLPAAIFLPSTSSGELSKDGLNELLEWSSWSDTILLPGDLGRNSQTTLLISDLIENTTNQLVIARDAVDSLQNSPESLTARDKTTIILSFAQLQKLVQNLKLPTPLSFTMDLVKLVEFLHSFTVKNPCSIVTLHQNKYIIATGGQVSTTPTDRHPKSIEESDQTSALGRDNELRWRTKYSSIAACYQTWNPNKPFEALTYSANLMGST